MKLSISITFYIVFNLLQGCVSYDNAIVYEKDYNPGSNNKLNFNGYYQDRNKSDYLAPMFFYKNGSVIYSGLSKDTIELKERILLNPKGFWGYWGNYKISGDTITIETFPPNINTFRQERYLRKGIIRNDKITFFQEINRKNKVNEIDEILEFINFKTKPDSTANWIRKKKKYNK